MLLHLFCWPFIQKCIYAFNTKYLVILELLLANGSLHIHRQISSILAIVTSFIIILFQSHHQFQCAQNSSLLCFSGLWTFFTYFVSFDLCGISHVLLNYSSYKHHVWLWTLNMSWDLTFGVISKKHLLLEAYCPSFLALFSLYPLHISYPDILDYPANVLPQSIVCLETISLLALKMQYPSSCFLESPDMISLPKLLLYRWHAPQHLPVWADLSTYSSRSQTIVKPQVLQPSPDQFPSLDRDLVFTQSAVHIW